MVHNLKVFEFTCYMTDVLPSSQKEWKVITPEVGGYDAKALDKMCFAGQPFMVIGRIGAGHNDVSLFNSSLLYKDGVYYITLVGYYANAVPPTNSSQVIILLQYDPVLKILKGRRP